MGFAGWRPPGFEYNDARIFGSHATDRNPRLCAGCHVIRGTTAIGRQGPDLTHFGRRRTLAAGVMDNNAENLASWIRNAPAIKPGSKMPQLGGDVPNALSEDQIQYIVAYLQSLQ